MQDRPVDVSELERLLAAVSTGSTVAAAATGLGRPYDDVRRELDDLTRAGMVMITGDSVFLTPAGLDALEATRRGAPQTGLVHLGTTVYLSPVARAIHEAWSAGAEERSERAEEQEAARSSLLASDSDRDDATRLLADGFAKGRLTRAEFDKRTSRALSARTYGDLDEVLHGLAGLPRPVSARRLPKALFWVMTVITAPFVLGGSLLVLAADQADELVVGLVLLLLFLPGLYAMWRWAWPRRV